MTTEAENTRTRLEFLEGLVLRLATYLNSGKTISPGSEAHNDLRIAAGKET